MKRHFTIDEDMQICRYANMHMKKCSVSLATREKKIITIMSYYYIPIKMAEIKSSDNTKCWQGCGKTGSLIHFW